MKLKDTFMSSPICVKILKYQCVPKNFPLLCRQLFSIHNLEADNFFQPTTVCKQFIYEKGNPLIKNNGPSLSINSLIDRPKVIIFHVMI